jgi:hypothetical protein
MMKPLLLLALAYIAPALLFLLFAQGWTWLYAIPLAMIVTNSLLVAKNGITRPTI